MTVIQSPITDLSNIANRVSEQQDTLETPAEIQRLTAEVTRLDRVRADLEAEIMNLRLELRASQVSRMLLASDISRLATEKVCALQDKDEQLRALQRKLDEASVKDRRLQALEATINSVQHSASWRLTKPLRNFMAIIRRVRGGASAGSGL
jgi:predicted  nucleic acid-binding Zn-ribbon protein